MPPKAASVAAARVRAKLNKVAAIDRFLTPPLRSKVMVVSDRVERMPYAPIEEGRIVNWDGRVWFVGLVNASRARLDPVMANRVVQADPVSGRTFLSYGSSVNICPTSTLEDAELEELDELALNRLVRLQEQHESEQTRRMSGVTRRERTLEFNEEEEGEENMESAARTTPRKGATNAVPLPVATQTKTDKSRAQRVRELAAAKAGTTKAKAAKSKGPAERDKECKCGCGEATSKYFVPGHDARFKGWMLKIERGTAKREELLAAEVIAQYKWVKRGEGMVTTTNYKGESHQGYAAK
jgi:hypothetical protein